MSNAGIQGKGKRKSSATYLQRGNRERNKARRIEKDARRAKPMECGHGIRHKFIDGTCRRCWGQR